MEVYNFKTNMPLRATDGEEQLSTELPESVRYLMKNAVPDETNIARYKDKLWVVSNSLFKHALISEYEEFKLCYQSPARGRGSVTIEAKPKIKNSDSFSILDFGIYSRDSISSAVYSCYALEKLLGYQIKIAYHGSDC